jgi:hypothetical protein
VSSISFTGSLGSGGSDYNLLQLFLDHFIVGNDSQKVAFFNQLVEKNETLENLMISKDANNFDEINQIIDFFKDLEDEEV